MTRIAVYWDLIQKPSTVKPFNVHTMLSQNVAVLRVFPNLSAAVVRAFLQDPIQGQYSYQFDQLSLLKYCFV